MIFQLGKQKPSTEEAKTGAEAVSRWRDAIQRIKPDSLKEIDIQEIKVEEMKAVEWPDPNEPIALTNEIEQEDDLFRLAPVRAVPSAKPANKSPLSLSQILADSSGDTDATRVNTTATNPIVNSLTSSTISGSRGPAATQQGTTKSEARSRPLRTVLPSDPKLSIDDDIKRRFGSNIRSALGSGTIIEGTFSFDSPVCIDGTLIGEVRSDSALIVGGQATVNAKITVGTLIVLGTVNGNVEASDLVEIRNGGSIEGDIVSARFAIEDGGWFRGKCTPTVESAKNSENNKKT